eukprot:m.174484 g.174484  ORF g.174484 m.174484 type:complete len:165 (+) comp17899_c0_seq6:620-1114(+)
MATGTGDAGAGASVAPLFPMRSDSALAELGHGADSNTASNAGSSISLTPRVSWADLPQPSDEDLLELCQLTNQPEQHDLNRKERRRTSREIRKNSANNVMTMPVGKLLCPLLAEDDKNREPKKNVAERRLEPNEKVWKWQAVGNCGCVSASRRHLCVRFVGLNL